MSSGKRWKTFSDLLPKHRTSGGLQVCEATNRRISQIGEAEIVLTFDSAMLGVGKTVAMMMLDV